MQHYRTCYFEVILSTVPEGNDQSAVYVVAYPSVYIIQGRSLLTWVIVALLLLASTALSEVFCKNKGLAVHVY